MASRPNCSRDSLIAHGSSGSTRMRKIHALISDDRVDFVAPADYQEKSQLDITVKGVLGRIARNAPEPIT